jgi:uncharacterized protein (TIGR03435 family)
MRGRMLPIGLVLFALCLPGQIVDQSLTFDVASVKPADFPKPDRQGRIMMSPPTGGPGTKDPGRIHYPFISMRILIMTAYDVKTFQVQGPTWLDSARFEINATMSPDTTTEQFHAMLRNLLAERFRLSIHRDTKELPMYSLTVARNGPKLKESEPGPPPGHDHVDDQQDLSRTARDGGLDHLWARHGESKSARIRCPA